MVVEEVIDVGGEGVALALYRLVPTSSGSRETPRSSHA